jgi:transcriptional antiterminator RfaH
MEKLCWFVVTCKPRQEIIAQENLLRQGFIVYLPRIQVKKRHKDKWVDKVEALFPRYLFIQLDPEKKSISPVRSTLGVVGLVSFGGQPAVISNDLIAAIRQHENPDSNLHQEIRPLFTAGERVGLSKGSLAGFEGVFVEDDGDKRVIVMLELLGKMNKVTVNKDGVVKK